MGYDIKQSEERIRQLRTTHGYTQEETAELLNMDRSYYTGPVCLRAAAQSLHPRYQPVEHNRSPGAACSRT